MTASSEIVVLGLGSNRGESRSILEGAARMLTEGLEDVRLSPLYTSDPLYVLDQEPFLNAAVTGTFSRSRPQGWRISCRSRTSRVSCFKSANVVGKGQPACRLFQRPKGAP